MSNDIIACFANCASLHALIFMQLIHGKKTQYFVSYEKNLEWARTFYAPQRNLCNVGMHSEQMWVAACAKMILTKNA